MIDSAGEQRGRRRSMIGCPQPLGGTPGPCPPVAVDSSQKCEWAKFSARWIFETGHWLRMVAFKPQALLCEFDSGNELSSICPGVGGVGGCGTNPDGGGSVTNSACPSSVTVKPDGCHPVHTAHRPESCTWLLATAIQAGLSWGLFGASSKEARNRYSSMKQATGAETRIFSSTIPRALFALSRQMERLAK